MIRRAIFLVLARNDLEDSPSLYPSVSPLYPPSVIRSVFQLDVDTTGSVRVERVEVVKVPTTIDAMGGAIDFLKRYFIGSSKAPIDLNLTAAPGASCDLSGTVVRNTDPITACASVTGP